jgi:drug/metabolite transporter (DMT)-like permease
MNYIPIYSKLLSEALLSLYPIIVKNINLSVDLQLWTRLITYVLISLFFINYSFINNNLLNSSSILLSIVNLVHIYSSYEGFRSLDAGVSFSIFNIYPLLILLMSGLPWKLEYFISIIGLIFFIISNYTKNNVNTKNNDFYYGLIFMIIASITEAIIYFMIKNIKTNNSWNHLFISYFFGTIITTIYVINKYYINEEKANNVNVEKNNGFFILGISILLNGIIGSIGYYLRFYSSYNLDAGIYSTLSYFGIITAYLYGYIFNNETIDVYKILGSIFIIISNILINKNIE